MTRTRRVGLRLFALGLGLLLGLGVAELSVRLLALAPPVTRQWSGFVADPHLPFKPRPHSHLTGRSESDEFDFDLRHNSLGFRDVEHPLTKEPGTFRILGLGDSFTYGGGATFEESYLWQLEQALNRRGGRQQKVEIIKAGVPRFYAEPERMMLEHYGLQFRPDLITVAFVPNDVIDAYFGLDSVALDGAGFLKTREAAELGDLGSLLFQHSHACRLVLRGYVAWRTSKKFTPRMDEVYRANGFHEADWQKIEREYDRMADLAASINAKLVVINIPQIGPWTPERKYPGERLAAWARRRGAGFVDTLPAFERHPDPQSLYYPIDKHCTPAGYALVAEAIYGYLTENKLVP
jgi:lysophospholipase L1-like esterase